MEAADRVDSGRQNNYVFDKLQGGGATASCFCTIPFGFCNATNVLAEPNRLHGKRQLASNPTVQLAMDRLVAKVLWQK